MYTPYFWQHWTQSEWEQCLRRQLQALMKRKDDSWMERIPSMKRKQIGPWIISPNFSCASCRPGARGSRALLARAWRIALFDFGSGSGRVMVKSPGFGSGSGRVSGTVNQDSWRVYLSSTYDKCKSSVAICLTFKNEIQYGWRKSTLESES